VRATKGQHKALEQDQAPAEVPKKRGRKKKVAEAEAEDNAEGEDMIRCVCGVTSDPGDESVAWVGCEQCKVWQHNVCMGVSRYEEDLEDLEYFCEQCRPQNHKELLAAMKRGEKLWLERQRKDEEQQAQQKKRGPKKGKGNKRQGGDKDEESHGNIKARSPAPEKKDGKGAAGAKRKQRGVSHEEEEQAPAKLRKVAGEEAVVPYTAPADLPKAIAELPHERQGPAKLVLKSLTHIMTGTESDALPRYKSDGAADGSMEARAERLALEIERAVHDLRAQSKTYYASQMRHLGHNLKNNGELYARIAAGSLTPPMLAAMKNDEMASSKLQRETAEMKARAEKQSILITHDGPRMRRTHKGDELVGDNEFAMAAEETVSVVRRPSMPAAKDSSGDATAKSETSSHEVELPDLPAATPSEEQQTSPTRTDFDINKVYARVNPTAQSPTTAEHRRRPSAAMMQSSTTPAPALDADIDRMLQDDRDESPPYSPSEESDPDVVWRGNVVMTSIANVYATAKHVGGADLKKSLGLGWNKLLPKRLSVAGRIETHKAVEYLCSLRYSAITDVIVVSLTPATDMAKGQFQALYDYFTSKKRYGVVGERGAANVRDTYLVPVPPGQGNQPEFMLNLLDNHIPDERTEPMLLLVLVYRNTPEVVSQQASVGTPTPAAPPGQRSVSISAPTFSPASPQGPFPPLGNNSFKTPVAPREAGRPSQQQLQQQAGEQLAAEVLGPFISAPTMAFIMPQAFQMTRQEWENIRAILEREEKSRSDLGLLGHLIGLSMEEATKGRANGTAVGGAGHGHAQGGPAGPPTAQQGAAPQMPVHVQSPAPAPAPAPASAAATATAAASRKQTPIPPPPIPPQATAPPSAL
jgi:hypothetical protein